MRGFARQTVDGLWLTGFSIDETNKTMTVRGRSLEAEVLPSYMQKLGHEPVFAGKLFGGLRIKQAESSVNQTDKATSLAVSAQPQATQPSNTLLSAPANAPAPQMYVEFELQGLEKASSQPSDASRLDEVKS
jgi:hypothetical protein